MKDIFDQKKCNPMTTGVVLLDEAGYICSDDPSWLAVGRLIKAPVRRKFLGCHYVSLFNHLPKVRQKVSRAIQRLRSCPGSLELVEIEDYSVVLRFSRVNSQFGDGFLVQHIEIDLENESTLGLQHIEVLDAISDGVVVLGASGHVEHVNRTMENIFGPALSFLLNEGELPEDYLFYDQDGEKITAPPLVPLWRKQCNTRTKLKFIHPNGDAEWFLLDARFRKASALKKELAHFSFINITREKATEEELTSARERLQLATDGANMGVWDWIPGTGEVVWNAKMYELFGGKEGEVAPGDLWRSAIHPEDRDRIEKELKCLKSSRDVRADFRTVWPDGSVHYIRAQARIVKNTSGGFRIVGVNWDISGEIATEKRLQVMAYNDALTGLPNRTTLMFRLNRAIARALRRQGKIAFLMLDLDNFKDINDNFGHLVGDAVLGALVSRLKPLVRDRDTFARLAGDEFAIVMESLVEPREAILLAQRLQMSLIEPLYIERGPAVTAYMSVGISVYPEDGEDATSILKAADLAMYASKRKGGNAISTYAPSMSLDLNRKVAMEYQLREAVREESFELYYQPIVQLDSGDIRGCEALIRWKDRSGKFVSPMDFIPIAEDCGLIPDIGRWVIETAFKQWLLWKRLNHRLSYISINVSPHQLYETEFSNELIETAKRYGIDPSNVQFEITEGTFLLETKNADTQLEKLVEAGFKLAIDDFGTGYSSLAYLKRFRVDVIKIDRSFIREIEKSKTDREIVGAILAMTQNLNFKTLVEGVEDGEQRNIVTRMGCEYAQGYYFGFPTFADEFAEKYLRH